MRSIKLRRRYSNHTEQVIVSRITPRLVYLANGMRVRVRDSRRGRAGSVVGGGQPSGWYVSRQDLREILGRRGAHLFV